MTKNKGPAKRNPLLVNGDGNGCEVSVERENIHLTSDVLSTTFSNYDFRLGEGYFADVYKFVCPQSKRVVALKHLRKDKFLRDEKSTVLVKNLFREIKVHRDLDHKNILKFYGSVENRTSGSHGGIYLVIQYAERGSLTDLMLKQGLDRTKILIYLEQILEGLHYLHTYENKQGRTQPIIHRDLRCHNVLMMADGTLKIADFGLSKRLNEIAVASGHQSQTGNAYWAGPEIITGTKGLEDSILVLTDIWSFGVLTLELFHYGAHMIPFIRIYRQMEYANKLGEGWGPKIPTDVPLEINQLLGRCFRYKMKNRSSAKDLLAVIQNFTPELRACLPITPHPTLDNETELSTPSCSASDQSMKGTLKGLETDPLARAVNDEVYLTRLFVPAPPTIPIRSDSMEHTQIIKAIAETELQRYISEDDAVFILEDRVKIDGTYHVKQKGNDELMFRTIFQQDEKILSIRCASKPNQPIFTINSRNKRDVCMSADLAGGIFAKVRRSNDKGIIPRSLTLSNIKMEITSIGRGAEVLTAMSPKPERKRLETVPGASCNSRSRETVYCTASEHFHLIESSTEFVFDNRNVDVKKSKQETYKYMIKYRELDRAEIGHFNASVEDGKCEIKVSTGANVAMVVIVVAFYYQQKCKKIRMSWWRNKLYKQSTSIKARFTKLPRD